MYNYCLRPGDVAQLVERLLCKQDVAGSNPVISTIALMLIVTVFVCDFPPTCAIPYLSSATYQDPLA